MYKVTYLDRNGYTVMTDSVIMVFDYCSDPAHALERELRANPDKPVVFFVTYHQKQHINKSIYELAQNHRRTYVMSNDVFPQNVPDTLEVAGMSSGDKIEDVAGGLTVKAYGTANKGVAFLVTDSKGVTIFHAGTLDDPEVVTDTKTDKNPEQCKTGVAINRVAEDVKAINIAFFPAPVDPQTHVGQHTVQFLTDIKVADFFPIHLGSDDKHQDQFDCYKINGAKVHFLREPGQSITLDE